MTVKAVVFKNMATAEKLNLYETVYYFATNGDLELGLATLLSARGSVKAGRYKFVALTAILPSR